MAIGLRENIIVDGAYPIDSNYGPYTSLQDAINAIEYDEDPDFNRRYLGLTVGIITSTTLPDGSTTESIEEYWWKDGIQAEDLVRKQTGGSTTIVNEIDDDTKTKTDVAVSPKAVADFVKDEVDSYLGGIVTDLSNI